MFIKSFESIVLKVYIYNILSIILFDLNNSLVYNMCKALTRIISCFGKNKI